MFFNFSNISFLLMVQLVPNIILWLHYKKWLKCSQIFFSGKNSSSHNNNFSQFEKLLTESKKQVYKSETYRSAKLKDKMQWSREIVNGTSTWMWSMMWNELQDVLMNKSRVSSICLAIRGQFVTKVEVLNH